MNVDEGEDVTVQLVPSGWDLMPPQPGGRMNPEPAWRTVTSMAMKPGNLRFSRWHSASTLRQAAVRRPGTNPPRFIVPRGGADGPCGAMGDMMTDIEMARAPVSKQEAEAVLNKPSSVPPPEGNDEIEEALALSRALAETEAAARRTNEVGEGGKNWQQQEDDDLAAAIALSLLDSGGANDAMGSSAKPEMDKARLGDVCKPADEGTAEEPCAHAIQCTKPESPAGSSTQENETDGPPRSKN